MKKKIRLDAFLVQCALAPTLSEARAVILAGKVLVDDRPVTKVGTLIAGSASVRLRNSKKRYVSRGGEKLAHALDAFHYDVRGAVAIDVGASTGGFTDCLLQHGVARVYAIDVGHGQLAEKLRRDPRVVVIDRTNIRLVDPQGLPEKATLAVIDVSFISLTKVLPSVDALLERGSDVIVLVKPQFELPREDVGKGGIVRSERLQQKAVEHVVGAAKNLGWTQCALTPSPILGRTGNQEYLVGFTTGR